MSIHPTAVVDPGAQIGEDVTIHPFTVIEPGVVIGDGCEIGPHAVIRTGTRMGRRNRITVGAVLGDYPQDGKFHGEESYLDLGNDNHVREYVTLHRATGEGKSTVIGDGCMLMAYAHVGHNSRIGSHVTMANCVQIAGHVVVEDYAIFGGLAAAHQFARIGTMVMVGGMSAVRQDAPHYMLVEGDPARPIALNSVGLKRRGITPESIAALKRAHRLIYRSGYNVSDGIAACEDEVPMVPEVTNLLEFLKKVPEGRKGRQMN
jgi:UDP-N-acetylglucosamine acyltransferase